MTSNLLAPEAPHPQDGSGTRRGHRVLATILIVFGTILTPLTIVALFVHTELTDTNRYVQTVTPLSANPAVQSFVADDISNRLIAKINEKQYIASLLPSQAQPLVGPIRSAFEGFVHSTTLKLVQSDQFQKFWEQANRLAHTQFQYVLTGKNTGAVKVTNGSVSIDMTALVNLVVERLQAAGINVFGHTPISIATNQIPIFQSKDLQKINGAMNLLSKLAFLLPFLVLACFGAAILLSRNRRRGFLWSAVGFGVGALLLALGLTIGRHVYLGAISGQNIPHDAAAAIYDTLVRFLRTSLRAASAVRGDRRRGRGIRRSVAARCRFPERGARQRRLARCAERRCRLALARTDRLRRTAQGRMARRDRGRIVRRAVPVVAPHAARGVLDRPGRVLLLGVVEYFGREPSTHAAASPLPPAGAAD